MFYNLGIHCKNVFIFFFASLIIIFYLCWKRLVSNNDFVLVLKQYSFKQDKHSQCVESLQRHVIFLNVLNNSN